MSLYKQFETSSKHETDGVTLDFGDAGKFRIARAGGANKAYLKAIEKLSRKYRRQIALDCLPEAKARRLFIEIYAETVMLGWEGVKDKDGNELPFTRENVVKVFTDLPDFFREIQVEASNLALYREEIDAQDAKNS